MDFILKKRYQEEAEFDAETQWEFCGKARHHCNRCPKLPGTILRINIPAGAVINFLNLIEILSPSGVCLIVRSPLLNDTPEVSEPELEQIAELISNFMEIFNVSVE